MCSEELTLSAELVIGGETVRLNLDSSFQIELENEK